MKKTHFPCCATRHWTRNSTIEDSKELAGHIKLYKHVYLPCTGLLCRMRCMRWCTRHPSALSELRLPPPIMSNSYSVTLAILYRYPFFHPKYVWHCMSVFRVWSTKKHAKEAERCRSDCGYVLGMHRTGDQRTNGDKPAGPFTRPQEIVNSPPHRHIPMEMECTLGKKEI